MTTDTTTETLTRLGATSAESVVEKFAEVRACFDADVAGRGSGAQEQSALAADWTGRKSGALTRIGDNRRS